jgi:hypothetical protein
MKRSKFFLSATTVFLAIVAIATTKSKKAYIVTGYYSLGAGCTVGVAEACTDGVARNCTFVTIGQSHINLFTFRFGNCANRLQKR